MIPAGAKVYVATRRVDFRKGPDGLAALVRDTGADPFSGALYVFRAKRADRVKIVWWDGSGLCLFAKRLDEDKFRWPRVENGVIRLAAPQLMALVEGMYARDGVEISRNTMANWMGHVGFHLAPLADRILALIKEGERVYADETTLPTLAPGSGKTKTAWLWTYARDDRTFGGTAPPMVAYRFEDSRGGENVERHLAGYTGLLQVHGCGAYNRLADVRRADGALRLAACWVHLRRKFYELHVSGVSHVANETIERMAGLWAIEEKIRGQNPDIRRTARQEQSAAIVAELWPFWERELGRISRKSKLAEAIRYARSRRGALERFLHDGRLDIDSNAVEQAIRPQTITRKNALFAGSDGGGKTWATIATLLQTAKMNEVDPFAWLARTLQRIAAGWPNAELDQLLPFNHHAG